jgi:hypothetical protein
MAQLNDRVTRHLGRSRRSLFDELERPALKKLPVEPYRYAEWKECRVGLDHHVEVEQRCYSVPHALLRQTVWVRITALFDHLALPGRNLGRVLGVGIRRKYYFTIARL